MFRNSCACLRRIPSGGGTAAPGLDRGVAGVVGPGPPHGRMARGDGRVTTRPGGSYIGLQRELDRFWDVLGATVEDKPGGVLASVLREKGYRLVGESSNLAVDEEVSMVQPVLSPEGDRFQSNRIEGEGIGRGTDGVQPPLASLSPAATAPPGRHPGRRPRPVASAVTGVRRPHPPAATGRDRATLATGAERTGSQVGQDHVRARGLRSSNKARGEALAGEWLVLYRRAQRSGVRWKRVLGAF